MLEVDRVLQLREEFILYKLDVGEGMSWLFNIENGDSFKLNETSHFMLSLFDGKRSVGEIQRRLFDEYPDTNHDEILKDLERLLQTTEKESIFEERKCE